VSKYVCVWDAHKPWINPPLFMCSCIWSDPIGDTFIVLHLHALTQLQYRKDIHMFKDMSTEEFLKWHYEWTMSFAYPVKIDGVEPPPLGSGLGWSAKDKELIDSIKETTKRKQQPKEKDNE